MSEQKVLKDSASNLNESIGGYVRKGVYDSADIKGKQLSAVQARLVDIQGAIDSLNKAK